MICTKYHFFRFYGFMIFIRVTVRTLPTVTKFASKPVILVLPMSRLAYNWRTLLSALRT